MSHSIIKKLIIVCTVATFCSGHCAEDSAWKEEPVEVFIKRIVEERQSASRVLAELAAARYLINSNKNETWVYCAHRGNRVIKYTDKTYTIVSLPFENAPEEKALRHYVALYNGFNLNTAASYVIAGKYKQAKTLLRLITYFNPIAGNVAGIQQQLLLLEKIEKGEDVETSKTKFIELHVEVGSHWGLADIEQAKPTLVDDIFQVRIP